MRHRLHRLHDFIFSWRHLWSEEVVVVFLAAVVLASPVSAVTKFHDRGLFMASTAPGATTSYTISFGYNSQIAVGSLDMKFCTNPIPYLPCEPPPGLDVSNATLSSQSGETGFSILPGSQTKNHITLTRSPDVTASAERSSYTFENIVNPANIDDSFAIRLTSYASTDASGPQIDVGGVIGQVTRSIVIQTQVPPMLIFCVGQVVFDNCSGTNGVFFSDMGELSSTTTLTAQSQMAVGTNGTNGFAIMAYGGPPAAGTNVIDPLAEPTRSRVGTNQFGMNLVANSEPVVGSDPAGIWVNAIPKPGYGIPNQYKYVPGGIVAYSNEVSLMREFTVSYIINASEDLRAGVYTTTITYVATGRF